jgi:hypothetical protein
VSRHDPHYEPPAAEVMPTEAGPAATVPGPTQVYGAITLMEDDGKRRRKRRRRFLGRRRDRSGE